MGRFFNQIVSRMKTFPRGVTKIKDSLDYKRKEFNNVETLRSQETEAKDVVHPPVGNEEQPKLAVPARRGRPRGTGRAHKSDT